MSKLCIYEVSMSIHRCFDSCGRATKMVQTEKTTVHELERGIPMLSCRAHFSSENQLECSPSTANSPCPSTARDSRCAMRELARRGARCADGSSSRQLWMGSGSRFSVGSLWRPSGRHCFSTSPGGEAEACARKGARLRGGEGDGKMPVAKSKGLKIGGSN